MENKKERIGDTFIDLFRYIEMLKDNYEILNKQDRAVLIAGIKHKSEVIEDYIKQCRKDIEEACYEQEEAKRSYLLQKVSLNMEFVDRILVHNPDED